MGTAIASPRKHSTIGTAHHFTITLDRSTYNLGSWKTASGLTVTWKMCDYRAGDSNHVWQFPGNADFAKIKLTRAACPDSATVQKWLCSLSEKHDPISGSIAMLATDGKEILAWTLRDMFPVSWSIDGFDAGGPKVMIETLELSHTGFLNDGVKYGKRGARSGASR